MIALSKLWSIALCFLVFVLPCSGCIWGTVAVVGVAVVGANVNEIQESYTPRNATKDLDEHLEHQKEVDEAISASDKYPPEPIDADEIVDTYTTQGVDE